MTINRVQRRSAYEIRLQLIRLLAPGPMPKTHIMYRLNTSWNQMHEMLLYLASCRIINEDWEGDRADVFLTNRGFEVYAALKIIDDAFDEKPLDALDMSPTSTVQKVML